jgi:hypothetical protein
LSEKNGLPTRRVSVVSVAILLFAAAVAFGRAALLIRGAPVRTAPSERRFFAWAYREPVVLRSLAAAAPALEEGETVCVQDFSLRRDPGWLRVMALYELPRQVVIVPGSPERIAATPACRRTVLRLRADGSVSLLRAPRGTSP